MSLPDFERIKLALLQRKIRPHLDAIHEALDRLTGSDIELAAEVGLHIRRGRGKMFRPTLLLLSAASGNEIPAAAVEAAAAVELVHIATLVHDDFIDDATTRRGQPAVNVKYGPVTALIMGDLLYTRALQHLARLNLVQPYQLMTDAAVNMCEAEMLQVQTRFSLDVAEEVYLRIICQKTASLIECACRIGASFLGNGAALERLAAQCGLAGLGYEALGIVEQINEHGFVEALQGQ